MTGAILSGHDRLGAFPMSARSSAAPGQGSGFVLTHHPDDADPIEGVTYLSCDAADTVGSRSLGGRGKNLEVFSPSAAR
jgi:hypothetical protein